MLSNETYQVKGTVGQPFIGSISSLSHIIMYPINWTNEKSLNSDNRMVAKYYNLCKPLLMKNELHIFKPPHILIFVNFTFIS